MESFSIRPYFRVVAEYSRLAASTVHGVFAFGLGVEAGFGLPPAGRGDGFEIFVVDLEVGLDMAFSLFISHTNCRVTDVRIGD